MDETFRLTRKRVILLFVLATLLGAGVAYAAIPHSTTGVISACYDPAGHLRVIDAEASETCRGNETVLSWNQQGPPGLPGIVSVREVIVSSDEILNTNEGVDLKVAAAKCGPGEVVTGGGFRLFASSRQTLLRAHVTESEAGFANESETPNVWSVFAYAPAGIGYWGIDARAMCAKLGS